MLAGPGSSSSQPLNGAASLIIYGYVIIAAMAVLFVVLIWVRKRFHTDVRQGARGEPGFSVDGLEALHRGGQISDEEFSRLRRAALGLDPGQDGSDNPSLSKPLEDDDESDVQDEG